MRECALKLLYLTACLYAYMNSRTVARILSCDIEEFQQNFSDHFNFYFNVAVSVVALHENRHEILGELGVTICFLH